MINLAEAIEEKKVGKDELAIFWLGQAGFVFKDFQGTIVYLDPYLTNVVEKLYGFKRIMPPILEPSEVTADCVVFTHHHEDHLDSEAVPEIMKACKPVLVGPPECKRKCKKLGIDEKMFFEMRLGDKKTIRGVTVNAVYADHGELAPDAIGFILGFSSVKVYITGDTAYHPDKMGSVIAAKPEIIIPVINGAYGNLNSKEAAELTMDVGAKIAIPCHYWMFVEHNGDPDSFIEFCKKLTSRKKVQLIEYGGCYIYIRS